jgi:hypothetical protein
LGTSLAVSFVEPFQRFLKPKRPNLKTVETVKS